MWRHRGLQGLRARSACRSRVLSADVSGYMSGNTDSSVEVASGFLHIWDGVARRNVRRSWSQVVPDHRGAWRVSVRTPWLPRIRVSERHVRVCKSQCFALETTSTWLNEAHHPVAELRGTARLCSAKKEVGVTPLRGASERVAADGQIAIAGTSAEVDNKKNTPLLQQKHDSGCGQRVQILKPSCDAWW